MNQCMRIPAPLFASCVTLGELLTVSVPQLMGIALAPPHRCVVRLME